MILFLISSVEPAPSTIVVLSLSIVTVLAVPKYPTEALSNLKPFSSLITVPPVNTAISSSIAFLLSPKPGALTAATLKVPRNLLTTKVANASPSKSSEMINKERPL